MRLLLPLLVACTPISQGGRVALPGPHPIDRGTSADDDLATAIEAEVVDALAQIRMPGMGVAVFEPHGVRYAGGFGWADLDTKRAMTPTTPVLLSSVSKTLIGVAAMQGVEAGRLELDARAGSLVDFDLVNPHVDGPAITLRHLLMHTSGIEDSLVYDLVYAEGDPTLPLGEFLEGYVTPGGDHYRRSNFSKRVPEAGYAYSNAGASLAAFALGEVAGSSFDTVVQRDILDPLGMVDSAYLLGDLTLEPAVSYGRAGDDFRPYAAYGYPTYPDGMMRSGAEDMGRYGAALLAAHAGESTLLSAESMAEMWTVDPRFSVNDGFETQALVFVERDLDGRKVMGHSGGDYGSYTELWFDVEAQVGVVFLFNATPSSFEDFKRVLDLKLTLMDLVLAGGEL